MSTTFKQLFGHTSEDTAYVAVDYDYDYTRTSTRYWVETKPKFGQRFVIQKLNPKTGKWNKPIRSIYYLAVVLGLNEEDGVVFRSVGDYEELEGYKNFRDNVQLDAYQTEIVGGLIARFEQVYAKQKELKAAGRTNDFHAAFRACVLEDKDIARKKRGEVHRIKSS